MKFSSGGIPHHAPRRDSLSGLQYIAEIGLDGLEMEFVRGVNMSADLAASMKKVSHELGLTLTAHAPYYINLNSQEEEKITASIARILQTAEVAHLAGARKITFHPAFYHSQNPEQVFQQVKSACETIVAEIKKNNWQVQICPETTGKPSQFGSLEELLRLTREVPGIGICIDFAHLCTRTNGELNGFDATVDILQKVKTELGAGALRELYAHLSGIEWTDKGERNHLMVSDTQNHFQALECLRALHTQKCDGIIICESPIPEQDALLMKEYWEKLD